VLRRPVHRGRPASSRTIPWQLVVGDDKEQYRAALERSVIGLARIERKAELAALRPVTEELLLTGAWTYSLLSPFRTVAGIAASATGYRGAPAQGQQAGLARPLQ
jgi:hypothetical protein